ncbi:MAG: thiamine phosphate synthase, partial [Bacilli bacterium]
SLQEIVTLSTIPVVAIGGITPENVHKVWQYNVDGVAVVRTLMCAQQPSTVLEKLRKPTT